MPKFHEAIAAIGFLGAEAVIAWVAVAHNEPQALGALIALTAAGTGFFLRGKVQPPDGQVTMTTATAASIPPAPALAPTVPPPAIPDPAAPATP